MSLVRTLAKVAVGVAVAKGASAMMQRRGGQAGAGQSDLGGLLGNLMGGGGGAAGGSMQDMLGGLLGGSAGGRGASAGGGLGGLLEQLGGGTQGAGGTGGLSDILGKLAGGPGASGVLGGLAGALGGGSGGNNASFGEVLNSQFDQTPQDPIPPSPDQEAAAALMLRAMIQAAKSDGHLDEAEQEKLMGQLGGDIDAAEAQFLKAEMRRPVDIDTLVSDTPDELRPQVYAMSLLAIDLDNQKEAEYLHGLASAFGMDARAVNEVHEKMGVPSLYA